MMERPEHLFEFYPSEKEIADAMIEGISRDMAIEIVRARYQQENAPPGFNSWDDYWRTL